ncbi:hypothetical protein BGZ54_007197 [Gamsiella multidivaricata]|nr:hypothetical protein BGZ54_007197 [Gamsiella multidivaricata]
MDNSTYTRSSNDRFDVDVEDEDEEESEEETLVRRPRPERQTSGQGTQSTSAPERQQRAQSASTPGRSPQAQRTPTPGRQQQNQRQRNQQEERDQPAQSCTPAAVLAKSKKASELSMAEALAEFTEVSRGQLELAQMESKRKHDLALKEQELALKEKELAIRQQELVENEKKREHERKMLDLQLAVLREMKECKSSRAMVLEGEEDMRRFSNREITFKLPDLDFLTEVVGLPENPSRSQPGSPSKSPKSPKSRSTSLTKR